MVQNGGHVRSGVEGGTHFFVWVHLNRGFRFRRLFSTVSGFDVVLSWAYWIVCRWMRVLRLVVTCVCERKMGAGWGDDVNERDETCRVELWLAPRVCRPPHRVPIRGTNNDSTMNVRCFRTAAGWPSFSPAFRRGESLFIRVSSVSDRVALCRHPRKWVRAVVGDVTICLHCNGTLYTST